MLVIPHYKNVRSLIEEKLAEQEAVKTEGEEEI